MISEEIYSKDQLLDFLREFFSASINHLQFIAKGVFSQSFSFGANNREYVLRVGSSVEGFRKDAFAYRQFSRHRLPIPEVISIGRLDAHSFYCISQKLPGKTLQEIPPTEEIGLISDLIVVLEELRAIAVPGITLYGTLDISGQGQFKTWKDFITNFSNWEILIHKGAGEIFRTFGELYKTSFLDETICEKCKFAIIELAPFCPEEKNFVHGDFGFGNVLTDGMRITGVLDWAELLCGDFLVDIAALDYGRNTDSFSSYFKEFSRQKSIPLPHFEERLLCYKIIMALKSIYLEANRNQQEWYEEEVEKLKKMGIV